MRIKLATLVMCLTLFNLVSFNCARAADSVWIESESPATIVPASIKATVDGDGKPEYLSGGEWLQISIDADHVGSDVPADGIVISYSFNAPSSGNYQVWNRIGFEAVRSQFDWRIDNGQWNTATPTDPTTDLVELQTWNPLAWLDMGSQNISIGAHTLQIRLTPQLDDKGKTARILYASDAFCLYEGVFHPNDQYAPINGAWQSDQDGAAASKIFPVPSPADDAQTSTPLNGMWQIARDDEGVVSDPSDAIQSLPPVDTLNWRSMTVPGDRDVQVPEWRYAHRYWLRTRVSIPAGVAGRSCYLHFPAVSMIATVFVDGKQCGYTNTPFAAWDCDITDAIKPGQTNDVWVGIKDWYYALPDYGAKDGGHLQYIPTDWVTKFGPANFTFPVWNHQENGILRTPSLVVAGPVYTSDVFAKPSVTNESLGLEITVQNPTSADKSVEVRNSIVPLTGGEPVKIFKPVETSVAAGRSGTVSIDEPFPNAQLWTPDSPVQYDVVTTLLLDGQPVDRRITKFGFREWSWSGSEFKLNGIPWHGRADLAGYGRADDEAVALWRRHGQNMERMWGEDSFSGLSPDDALDFYDSRGIVIRRTGIFDGEAARYQLVDGSHVRPELFDHWRQQLLAWAKGERNHPSIFIWSIENEIAFINAKVTGESAIVDPAERSVSEALQQLDPTRPVMTDGGNALLDESMPVYGGHYIEPDFTSLPDGAYDSAGFAHRQIWPITQSKPILLGESFYANGDLPGDFATVGGESAFLGKAEARPAIGLVAKMLSEGYRWNGISFHFWIGGESDSYYNSWQPTAVLCRQWNWTFSGGKSVDRTLRIFNDTADASPITLKCTLSLGQSAVSSSKRTYTILPGETETVDEPLTLPSVTARTEGTWTLSLSRRGNVVYSDSKPLSILPSERLSDKVDAGSIAVYDPSNVVETYLRSKGTPFTPLLDLTNLPVSAKVVLVGANSIASDQPSASTLAAYASAGHSVIVLEQRNPLKFSGTADQLESTGDNGEIAFAEDLDNPIFAGLKQQDFFYWGQTGEVYSNAYLKSATTGKDLVECGSQLKDSSLTELNPESGLILLCQLNVESELSSSPAARRVLINMIHYGLTYKRIIRTTTVVSTDNKELISALDAIHLSYAASNDPLSGLSVPGSIEIIDSTPANLMVLSNYKGKVDQYTNGGGWIVLNNLTPAGVQPYDTLVGYDHIIRPFRQEKVQFDAPRNPLTLGLSASDIVMGNGHDIFNFEAGQYPDQDEFSYVVDTDDIAPFCTSPFFAWGNITNGFTMADGFWPLIINFPAPSNGKPFDIPITMPRQETVTGFTFVGDNNYWPQTTLNLAFPNGDNLPLTYDHGDVSAPAPPQSYEITPPRTVSSLTLQVTGWDQRPGTAANIGIDNIYMTVKRPPDFAQKVRSMLNIGALVEYPNGKGGIILCNVKFMDPSAEANSANTVKKRTIIRTILKNLDAEFVEPKGGSIGAATP